MNEYRQGKRERETEREKTNLRQGEGGMEKQKKRVTEKLRER